MVVQKIVNYQEHYEDILEKPNNLHYNLCRVVKVGAEMFDSKVQCRRPARSRECLNCSLNQRITLHSSNQPRRPFPPSPSLPGRLCYRPRNL
ncbi:hypothetical protein E2C01_011415 [Portunus trituberculatus]|uniref:Uncharacterized protein n=1 Tax=Portunus trituberculatus TaxID=210409 RepID=A0A5B7DAY9_PORTR|nr:hypothetical protein [Portunus trituberculatus]